MFIPVSFVRLPVGVTPSRITSRLANLDAEAGGQTTVTIQRKGPIERRRDWGGARASRAPGFCLRRSAPAALAPVRLECDLHPLSACAL